MKQWAGLLSLGLVCAGVGPEWGQDVVVVNAANSIQDISKKQLIDIYTGKMASWSRKKSRFILQP